MIEVEPKSEADGAVALPSGGSRADFVFLTRAQLGARYPGVPLDALPARGGVGLVISADPAAAARALGDTGVRSAGAICVPPAAANGTLLAFAGT